MNIILATAVLVGFITFPDVTVTVRPLVTQEVLKVEPVQTQATLKVEPVVVQSHLEVK
jgi:hypothetical protein